MFTDKLNRLKDERKLTNQQISDLSGVPLSTVTRILNGQTDNPNFQTIIEIVTAMGGSLDELTGLSNSEKTKETENELISCYKGIIEIKNNRNTVHISMRPGVYSAAGAFCYRHIYMMQA